MLNDRAVLHVAARCLGRPSRAQQAQSGHRPEYPGMAGPGLDRARHGDIAPIGHFRHSGRGITSIVLALNRSCQWTSVEPPSAVRVTSVA